MNSMSTRRQFGAVVFTDDVVHPLARRLRPGYRHVFAIVPSPNGDFTSVVIDVKMDGILVQPVDGIPQEVATHYRNHGLEALTVDYAPEKRQLLPTMLNTCVAVTKQLMGLNTWALTPWQLRQHILKEQQQCAGSTSPFPG